LLILVSVIGSSSKDGWACGMCEDSRKCIKGLGGKNLKEGNFLKNVNKIIIIIMFLKG